MPNSISQADQLHMCLMIIAEEIKRICEKHNISYFIIGGTLLGAVRHKGFIPWDDDMDIGMIRSEYDRFVAIVNKEIGPDFFVTSNESEENYGKLYLKVRLKGTHFYEEGRPSGLEDGIFVDIFPIDRIPNRPIQRKIQMLRGTILQFTLLVKCGYQVKNKRVVPFAKLLSLFYSKHTLYRHLLATRTKYNQDTTLDYTNLGGTYPYGKDIMPKECIGEGLITLQFESTTFSAPKNPGKMLAGLYGDYMKFPPKDECVFKHTGTDIDFGKYVFEP